MLKRRYDSFPQKKNKTKQGALYSLMFGLRQGSVFKTVLSPSDNVASCDLDGELSHWHSYQIVYLYLSARDLNDYFTTSIYLSLF